MTTTPPILFTRSNVPGRQPTTANLPVGALALNTADGLLYTTYTPAGSGAATVLSLNGAPTVTLSGDASGSGTTASSIAVTLAAVGTAGTYSKVVTDAKGRVTAGSSIALADVVAALGYTPLALDRGSTIVSSTSTLTTSTINTGVLLNPTTNITVTLPTAASEITNSSIAFRHIGTAGTTVTLQTSGSDTLDETNAATLMLSAGDAAIIAPSGTVWRVLIHSSSPSAPVYSGYVNAATAPSTDNSTKLATTAYVQAQTYLAANQTITVSGDATGSGSTSVPITLAAVGTAGTYNSVVTDAKGRITSGTSLPVLLTAGTAVVSTVMATGSTTSSQWTTQGSIIGYNYSAGNGETDFICCRGGLGGGFRFYTVASAAGSSPVLIGNLGSGGNLVVPMINSSPIGNTTPSTGAFTTLTSSGSMTAPTVASTDSSTNVATTAYVRGQIATASYAGIIVPGVGLTVTSGTVVPTVGTVANTVASGADARIVAAVSTTTAYNAIHNSLFSVKRTGDNCNIGSGGPTLISYYGFTPSYDVGSNYNATTYLYVTPVAGYYRCESRVRLVDGSSTPVNYGHGVSSSTASNYMLWTTSISSSGGRNSSYNAETYLFAAGVKVGHYWYADSALNLSETEMTITLVALQ